jgi:hypothetical protein
MTIEVLKADVVLAGYQLLDTDESKEKFAAGVNAELMEVSLPPALTLKLQSPKGAINLAPRSLRIEKHRITIELGPGRTVITMDYPLLVSLQTLCDLTGKAVIASDLGDQQLQALGFNVHLVRDLPKGVLAGGFIASHLSVLGDALGPDFELQSGTLSIVSTKGNQLWTINGEPRFGDARSPRVYMTTNLHYEGKDLSAPLLRDSFREVWDQAHRIAEGFVPD